MKAFLVERLLYREEWSQEVVEQFEELQIVLIRCERDIKFLSVNE